MAEEIGLKAVLEDKDFQSGISKYMQSVDKASMHTEQKAGLISRSFSSIGKIAQTALGTAIGFLTAQVIPKIINGLGDMVFGTAAAADALVEMSDKTGISTTSLQEFKYIGEQTGTSLETVTSSLARLTKGMAGAADGKGPVAEAFKTIGVSVTDASGNLRDSEIVFQDVLTALSLIPNETERDALAMQIFGRSAQELNPLILAGAAGLDAMRAEAQRLGIVMSEESLQSAAAFNDQWAALKMSFQGIVAQVGGALIPILSDLIQKYIMPAIPTIVEMVQAFGQFITNITTGGTGLGTFGGFIEDLGSRVMPILTGAFEFVKGAWEGLVTALTALWNDILKPVLDIFVSYWQEALPLAIGILTNFWNTSLMPAFQTLIDAWQENIQPLLADLYDWLKENIPIAIQAAADFWLYVLWPALSDVFEFIGDNVIPIITDLAVWLMENIPVAIQTASDFWNNVLQPALAAVYDFIAQNVIPIIVEIIAWLAENLPVAIQTVSNFWTGTLLPAINDVYNFFVEYILPIIEDVIEICQELGEIALTALAGIWENVLLPAITKVYNWFNEKVLPVLKDIADFITKTVGPAVKWFAEEVLLPFANTISGAVKNALDWLHGMLEKIKNILSELKLPDWLTPGSPPPLYYAALSAAEGIDELTDAFERLREEMEKGGGKKPKMGWMFEFLEIAGKFGQLGAAAARRAQNQFEDQMESIEEAIAQQEEIFRTSTDFQKQVEALREIQRLEQERNRLTEEYAETQEKIAELQKAQADIAFLRAQLDFLKLIKDEGLNIGDILGGLQLGLDVSLPGLIEAMTRAMQGMITAVNEELEAGSPSRVFFDIGKNIQSSLAQGLIDNLDLPTSAMRASLPIVASPMAATPLTTSATYNNMTFNMNNNLNSQLDLAALQGWVENTIVERMRNA